MASARPAGGGTPVTLKSSAAVQVGSSAIDFAIALAGFSNHAIGAELPCIVVRSHDEASCPYSGMPLGSAVVWPQNVVPANYTAGWYVIFQSTSPEAGAAERIDFALAEQGVTVMTYDYPFGVDLPEGSLGQAGAGESLGPNSGYSGPAVLTVTAAAGTGTGKAEGTAILEYTVPIVVLPTTAGPRE